MTTEPTSTPADVPDQEEEDDGILKVWELAPDRTPIQFTKGGEVHYLRSVHRLSMQDRADYDQLRKKSEQLSKKRQQTEAIVTERGQVDRKLTKFVLPEITDEQLDELHPLDRETAIAVFIAAFGRTMRKLGQAIDKAAGVSEEIETLLAAARAEDETDDEPTPES